MIGKTVSHYKILKKLSEGGMGVVYKAYELTPKYDHMIRQHLEMAQAVLAQQK